MSPFESLYRNKPDYQFLKVCGCACFPDLQPYNKHKLEFKISKCLFLGYNSHHKGYRFLHTSGCVYIARSVTFDETSFPYRCTFNSSALLQLANFEKSYRAPECVIPVTPSAKILNDSSSTSKTHDQTTGSSSSKCCNNSNYKVDIL